MVPFSLVSFPDDVPVLRDGDVTLRALGPDDLDAVVEQSRDAESLRWTTIPAGYDDDAARCWLSTNATMWADGSERVFAVEARHRDRQRRYAGTVTLRDDGHGRATLGFVAHPGARGLGVTTIAVGILLRYGFDTLGLQTVRWEAERGNWPSWRIAWRLGFTFEGIRRRWLPGRDGGLLDAWTATRHVDDAALPTRPWAAIPTLRAQHVVLRPLAPEDDPRLVEGCNDPVTARWLPMVPSPYRTSDAQTFRAAILDGAAGGRSCSWAIADATDDRFLGTIGTPRRGLGGVEIGYWVHPDARRRGVALEAVERLVGHVFAPTEHGGLGAVRAYVRIDEANTASLRVAQAAGFAMAGSERAALPRRTGLPADALLLDRVNPLLEH